MTNWTVLLARPDYVANDSLDTYLTHVAALTPRLALNLARAEACAVDEVHEDDAIDYACLLLIEGTLNDLNPEL